MTVAVLCFIIRLLSSDDFVYSYFNWNTILKYKTNYISTYLACAFSLPLFYYLVLPNNILDVIQKTLFSIGITLAIITVFLPIRLVSLSVMISVSYGVFTALFILVDSIFNFVKNPKNNLFLFLGVIIGVSFFVSFLFRGGALYTYHPNLSDFSIVLYVIMYTFLKAQQISTTFIKEKILSADLENRVDKRTTELKKTIKQLEKLSARDGLTGIYNQRKFHELGNREIAIHQRHKRPLSLIMLDIDLFKNINDTYGHKTGDTVLKFLTSTCRQEIRGTDILGRIGGDEFALLLLETKNNKAYEIAENIRFKIQAASKQSHNVPDFTISLGVVTCRLGETLEDMLERADIYLYKAKNSSRNTVSLQKNYSDDGIEFLELTNEN
ncbi:MAG: hypothetical protein BKP49_03895 [Treponema sp. CETP13]|nr:MAG: hypothetical protein BKP49_03895 [Treponema sp. CETP13]